MGRKTSHVKRLMSAPLTDAYAPSLYAVRFWFGALNREVFRNDVPPVYLDVRPLRGRWAVYFHEENQIVVNAEFRTKQQFVAVLGHEMVHRWCYVRDPGNLVMHGARFFQWKEVFSLHGMELRTVGDVHLD